MASAARRSRRPSGAFALTAVVALLSPARPARADSWSLLGHADAPGFVEPIGPGKALVCSSRRCAVWDVATASSTPTEGTLWWSGQVAHAPLPNGSVIIVDGSNNRPARIWSLSTGRWRDAATPPEMLGQPRIATLADGRIILTGDAWAARRPRAYVADANVRAWALLAEAPTEPLASHAVPKLVPVRSGLVLLSYNAGETPISRFSAATNRWEAVTVDGWTEEHKLLTTVWGDDVVVFARRDRGWDAIVVGPGGEKRRRLPQGLNDGVAPENISAAAGAEMLFLQAVGENGKRYVWRRADEAPREIVSVAGASISSLAAVDDRHVVGLVAFAVRLLSLDDRPDHERPCDGVERFLRDGFGSGPVTKAADPSLPAGFDLTVVSDACRDQVRRGEAPQLLALVRGWTARPEAVWRDLGRTLSCAIQDPGALPAIPSWFSGRGPRVTRSICISELITWPNAEVARAKAFEKLVTSDEYGWDLEEVLPSALSSNPSPALRDELVPALQEAQRQSVQPEKRQGADIGALYLQICAGLDEASIDRRTACARGPSGGFQASRHRVKHPVLDIGVTLVAAGLVAGTYAARNSDLGRTMATGAGALGGATLGLVAGATLAIENAGAHFHKGGSDDGLSALLLGATVAGSVLGGVAAYYATSSPSARAPVAGLGLAFPYLAFLVAY
jgi:hypothetical protein